MTSGDACVQRDGDWTRLDVRSAGAVDVAARFSLDGLLRRDSRMLGIVLALGSSVAWGTSDFLGGLRARRMSALTVLLVSQPVGLVLARDRRPDRRRGLPERARHAHRRRRRGDRRHGPGGLLQGDGPRLGDRGGDDRRARRARARDRRAWCRATARARSRPWGRCGGHRGRRPGRARARSRVARGGAPVDRPGGACRPRVRHLLPGARPLLGPQPGVDDRGRAHRRGR